MRWARASHLVLIYAIHCARLRGILVCQTMNRVHAIYLGWGGGRLLSILSVSELGATRDVPILTICGTLIGLTALYAYMWA
jgi:hypothetical protein